MPTYDYRCKKCGTVFEVRHGFDEKPPKTCKVKGCRGKLERLFSPPAIIFKGKGWYVTDNGPGNGKPGGNGSDPDKAAKAAEKSSEKAADKTEKKSSDKPIEKKTATADAKS